LKYLAGLIGGKGSPSALTEAEQLIVGILPKWVPEPTDADRVVRDWWEPPDSGIELSDRMRGVTFTVEDIRAIGDMREVASV
jgi:hypothetical protein